jgi:ABC-type sugar transport system substrate-binding protein
VSSDEGLVYYDRDGNPITLEQWTELQGNRGYRVAETNLVDGTDVSTMWLGIDRSGQQPPAIYETVVFNASGDLVEVQRHPTMRDALAAHQKLVAVFIEELS